MKISFIFLAVLLIPYLSQGQTSVLVQDETQKNWTTEAQLNTASNSSSATFGPSLLYRVNSKNQLGLRFLAPANSGDQGTMSLMAVYRHHFGENKTNLFAEGTAGTNWYAFGEPRTSINAPSLGTNIGVIHHLTEDISFGGIAGMEWTRTHFEKNFASNEANSVYLWGRIALFGSLSF